jgi:hypothetical protein
MQPHISFIAVLLSGPFAIGVAGCSDRTGEEAETTMENMEDTAGSAAEDTGDNLEEAGDDLEDATDDPDSDPPES